MNHLSGGQRTRVGLGPAARGRAGLACCWMSQPTTWTSRRWSGWKVFLPTYRGAVLVVSHDRRFLDHTVRRILELDPEQHTLREYPGSYSDYQKPKRVRSRSSGAQWKDQQTEIRRLEQDIRQTKEHALSTERGTNNDHLRRLAKKVAQRAKAKEKRLQRYMIGEERVERPDAAGQMRLQFAPNLRSGQVVITLNEARQGL